MIALAIETAAGTAGVAVVDETKTIAEYNLDSLKKHAETIMPMTARVLELAGLTLGDVDCIACSGGPGSFTGLRIGAATAKGLAHGADKKIIPVPTLDALAYNVFDGEKLITPVMDARRNQVYTALYRWEDGELRKLTPDMAQDLDLTLDMVKAHGQNAVFVGDGAVVFRERIQAAGFLVAPPHLCLQRAAAVGALGIELAKRGVFSDYKRFTPSYVRAPQAEREYNEKLRKEQRGDK